jgi:hypothetical protein
MRLPRRKPDQMSCRLRLGPASRYRYRHCCCRWNGDKPSRLSVRRSIHLTDEPVKTASTAKIEVDNIDVDTNVIRFQPRSSGLGPRSSTNPPQEMCKILSLSKYEQSRAPSKSTGPSVSVSAFIFTVTLAIVGAWIVLDLETKQDCASVTMCSHMRPTASF